MKEKTNVLPFTKDEEKAKALWDVSEELGGIEFDLVEAIEVEIDESPEDDTPDSEESPEKDTHDSATAVVEAPEEDIPEDGAEENEVEDENA
mmetsp:Transcript_15374/g.24152  ORF Transcript_15374/g.24152 Transcript_15374/m.24152 type:complete len:92 (+) Transcript_15374:3-278(+)